MANDIYFNKNKNTYSDINPDLYVEKIENIQASSNKSAGKKTENGKKKKAKKKRRIFRKLIAAVLCLIILVSGVTIALSGLLFRNYSPEPLKPNEHVDSSELMSSIQISFLWVLTTKTLIPQPVRTQ